MFIVCWSIEHSIPLFSASGASVSQIRVSYGFQLTEEKPPDFPFLRVLPVMKQPAGDTGNSCPAWRLHNRPACSPRVFQMSDVPGHNASSISAPHTGG